jgi:ankyrin repeat protein
MGRKKITEAQILDEIRRRVIEESQNSKQEKERIIEEKITLEALQEITDLAPNRIQSIAESVREEFAELDGQRKKKQAKIGKIILITLAVVVPVGFASWGIGAAVVKSIKLSMAREENQRKSDLSIKYWELIKSAEAGNLELVQYLVKQGTPVHMDWWEYNTPLMGAVLEGHTQVIEWLLANGADVTYKDKDGKRASDLAEAGTFIAVRQIIGNAMAEAAPEDGPVRTLWKRKLAYTKNTFLAQIRNNKPDAVSLFLQADNGRFAHDWEYEGIQEAAKLGNVSMLTLLLADRPDIQVDFINEALLAAASAGQLKAMDFLLAQGADINFRKEYVYSFRTPLIVALEEKNTAAEYLLQKGADPDKPEGDDLMPPITVPIYNGDWARITKTEVEQVKLLIRYGADVNQKDEDGISPIEWAMSSRYDSAKEIVKILQAAGAEIPFTEKNFRRLISANDMESVRIFLEKGADPNMQGFDEYDKERTALMQAAAYGHTEIARLLLQKGADVSFRTSYHNHTALYLAVYDEHVEMVRLLLQYKAAITKEVLTLVDDWAISSYSESDRKTIKQMIRGKG